MSLFKSNTAPKEDREPRYHVVVSDSRRAYDLKGPLDKEAALQLFDERVADHDYSPFGPVRLRVIGEREYAAINAAAVASALLES